MSSGMDSRNFTGEVFEPRREQPAPGEPIRVEFPTPTIETFNESSPGVIRPEPVTVVVPAQPEGGEKPPDLLLKYSKSKILREEALEDSCADDVKQNGVGPISDRADVETVVNTTNLSALSNGKLQIRNSEPSSPPAPAGDKHIRVAQRIAENWTLTTQTYSRQWVTEKIAEILAEEWPSAPAGGVREPHDGWMNMWLYANTKNDQNLAYLWNPEARKFAGDWADFRVKNEVEQLRQVQPAGGAGEWLKEHSAVFTGMDDIEYVAGHMERYAAQVSKSEREARERAEGALLRVSIQKCYCACHSPVSSRPSCVHCQPEYWKDKPDPYCGVTALEIGSLAALKSSQESK